MAAIYGKTLYPPLVESSLPAFDMEEQCLFYFNVSTLNNFDEIKHIQVTIINQKTNKNALSPTLWMNGIKFVPMNEVFFDKDKDQYYFIINKSDLEKEFENTFYKIQIRFSAIDFDKDEQIALYEEEIDRLTAENAESALVIEARESDIETTTDDMTSWDVINLYSPFNTINEIALNYKDKVKSIQEDPTKTEEEKEEEITTLTTQEQSKIDQIATDNGFLNIKTKLSDIKTLYDTLVGDIKTIINEDATLSDEDRAAIHTKIDEAEVLIQAEYTELDKDDMYLVGTFKADYQVMMDKIIAAVDNGDLTKSKVLTEINTAYSTASTTVSLLIGYWTIDIELYEEKVSGFAFLDKKRVEDYSGKIDEWTTIIEDLEALISRNTKQISIYEEWIVIAATQPTNYWLNDNVDSFSEFSTVCLIKAIPKPLVSIIGLSETSSDNEVIYYNNANYEFIGKYDTNGDPEESLKFYRFTLKDKFGNVLDTSDDVYEEIISYVFNYSFSEEETYTIILSTTSKNGYVTEMETNIRIVDNSENLPPFTITTVADGENEGRIGVKISSTGINLFSGSLIIRRASSRKGFMHWEDIIIKNYYNATVNETFYDYAIESGVWYQYGIQIKTNPYQRSKMIKTEEPAINEFEDMFLYENGTQFKVKFNSSVSNYKRVVLESKVNTIGSAYPFITRNAKTNYKEFTISGLIHSITDTNNLFTNKNDLFYGEDIVALYDEYNKTNGISQFYDYTLEREFRERVLSFLNNGNIKLYKSSTEGNMLVRLTNVNLTPEATTHRLMYSFTATVSEIADFSLATMIESGLMNFDPWKNILFLENKVGQVYGKLNGENIFPLTEQKYNRETTRYIYTVKELSNVRVEAPEGTEINFIQEGSDGTFTVYVGSNGFYYFDKNIRLSYLSVNSFGEECQVDYLAVLNKVDNISNIYSMIYTYTIDGQIIDNFALDEDICIAIEDKYKSVGEDIDVMLDAITGITVETEPGAVLYINNVTKNGTEKMKFKVGDTGVYCIKDAVDIKSLTIEYQGRPSCPANVRYDCLLKRGVKIG